MKKIALSLLMLFTSAHAYANGFSSKLVVQNITLWHGLQFSDPGVPSVAGGITYDHDSGAHIGTYTNNLNNTFGFKQEFMHWIGYTYKQEDWSITGDLFRYYFPYKMSSSSYDVRATFVWKNLTAFASYMPEYFWGADDDPTKNFSGLAGNKSSDIYIYVTYVFPIEEKVSIVPYIGYSRFSDPTAVGNNNYLDYNIALRHTSPDNLTVEIGYSNTNRQLLNPSAGAPNDSYAANWGVPYTTSQTPSASVPANDGRFFLRATKIF